MKLIEIAICSDNRDPKGLGRIRYKVYNENPAVKEGALDYEPWGDKDRFVAQPFLPLNINFIPEIGQAVKIITYDVTKRTVNQEYIAGPFVNSFDFNSQTVTQQLENTTYGSMVKDSPKIYNNQGQLPKESTAALAEKEDFAIYGKYGSDVLFTKDGLQLRGGKLLSKDAASSVNKTNMLTFPRMAQKSSRVYLKKFPKTLTLKEIEKTVNKTETKVLNTIIEYSVDSLSSPKYIDIFVYKVNPKPYGPTYNTNYFSLDTPLSGTTLINLSGDTVSPTLRLEIPPTIPSTSATIRETYLFLRETLRKIDKDGLGSLNPLYLRFGQDIFPYYFRPTKEFYTRPGNLSEKETVLSNTIVRNIRKTNGLIWSQTKYEPETKQNKEKVTIPIESGGEQSFGTVMSDKIYFLSTDTIDFKTPGKPIDFAGLNKYDLTQMDYVDKIERNTFSTVRGEKLLEFLLAMYNVLTTHVHNVNQSYARTTYAPHDEMEKLFKSLADDVLNRSIRIN